MRRILLILMLLVAITACNSNELPKIQEEPTETIIDIDWVDFVKINDQQYSAHHTVAIADDRYIGDEVGKVEFKVDKNVTDTNYQVKNGDAAFWEEGTLIYEVVAMPDMIAIKDKAEVNGYRLYQANEAEDDWSFEAIDRSLITKIEVQEGYIYPKLIQTFSEKEEINTFLKVLDEGEENVDFTPNIDDGDPELYHLVFYTDSMIVTYYQLNHDGETWYWYPWEQEMLPDEIGDYIK